MKIHLFSVFDKAANAYLPPFNAITAPMAQRMFREACNDPNHRFNTYAADYTLFELGYFEDQTGETVGITPTNLGNALIYMEEPCEAFTNPPASLREAKS